MKKADRQKIFEKYGGRCAYCGCELNNGWQVDHAISKQYWFFIDTNDIRSVNKFENLNPACRECNHYKRSHCVDSIHSHVGFRDYMMTFHKRLAKLPKKTMVDKTKERIKYMMRIAEKYNITTEKPFCGVFYFELFTQSKTKNNP